MIQIPVKLVFIKLEVAGRVEEPLPVLQKGVSQQEVQAYNFVRSPIIMQPDSQVPLQRRSKDHIFAGLVEFSVLVVYEKRFTFDKYRKKIRFTIY